MAQRLSYYARDVEGKHIYYALPAGSSSVADFRSLYNDGLWEQTVRQVKRDEVFEGLFKPYSHVFTDCVSARCGDECDLHRGLVPVTVEMLAEQSVCLVTRLYAEKMEEQRQAQHIEHLRYTVKNNKRHEEYYHKIAEDYRKAREKAAQELSKITGEPVWELLGVNPPRPYGTVEISLDEIAPLVGGSHE